PFGSWLIPTIGSLLCILLMKGITKATGFRFLVWIALGQIIYFSYGFWHSKQRKLLRNESNLGRSDLAPSISSAVEQRMENGFQLDLITEDSESAV
ncbi:unnamed protein product, partial [Rotaria sp. Silwood2]